MNSSVLNLANRMKLTGINQLWVADITCIRLQREFVFLAVTRWFFAKSGGMEIASHVGGPVAAHGAERALEERKPGPGLVHHSDRGLQAAPNT
jgi:putative transposase